MIDRSFALVLGLCSLILSLGMPTAGQAAATALVTAKATGTAAAKSQTNEFYAEFGAISLKPNADLTGTAVTVLNAKAWVSPTDAKDPPTAYQVRLISWTCVKTDPNCPTDPPPVYYISDADFVADKKFSLGMTVGVLAVPFKFHPTDEALTTGSTIGGYVGFTQDWGFTQVSEILGGGLALVSSTSATSNFSSGSSSSVRSMDRAATIAAAANAATSSTPTTSTLTGLSIATGLLGKLGNTNTQFGILVGTDVVEKSASYKYNGKLWLSFSVGYSFSN